MAVIDVNEADFSSAVLDRSRTVPVVVDFWAQWCGPCRALGPALERAVAGRAGKLELAKVDVDANPGLSARYRIQSIPVVKAFSDGEVAAEFVGAQPPLMIERFLDSLVPSEVDALVALGDEQSLRRAVELEPARADAALPLARILYARGEQGQALELLERVPASFGAAGLAARIGLERGEHDELSDAFAALDDGDSERALNLLLEALPAADGARDDIRRVIVGVLDELGAEHPLARAARRRLAAALY